MCTVYTGYHGTSEIEHGLVTCTVDDALANLGDYLCVQAHKPCSISHFYRFFFFFFFFLRATANCSKVLLRVILNQLFEIPKLNMAVTKLPYIVNILNKDIIDKMAGRIGICIFFLLSIIGIVIL